MKRTALVVGDVQAGILENFPFSMRVLGPVALAVVSARAAGTQVIFVRAALRRTGVDLSPRNGVFGPFHKMGNLFHEGFPGSQVDARVYPLDDDTVITKRRTSAFAHTELDLILRANDIQHVTLCGIATGAMVAATVYDASDRDYEISVLRDACADPDDRVHDLFVNTVFPSRGVAVLSAQEWVDKIKS